MDKPLYEPGNVIDFRFTREHMPDRVYVSMVYQMVMSDEWMYQCWSEKSGIKVYLSETEISRRKSKKSAKCYEHPIVKDMMSKVSHIAFMGRSFGYHLIFISQQFNAKVLDTAIREQFGIKIYMGSTISTESATMLFPNADIDKSIHLPRFCGYISTLETELDIIQIPFIEEPSKLKDLLVYNGKRYGKRA